jgi:hypothetical protein
LGFGVAMLVVSNVLPGTIETGLIVAGIGFWIVMPSVIKAVICVIGQRYARLAPGKIISTFQFGVALGVAIIGGVPLRFSLVQSYR